MRRNISPLLLVSGAGIGFLTLMTVFAVVVARLEPEETFSRIDELDRVTLSDGSDLVLHAVTYGPTHSVETRRLMPGVTPFSRRVDVTNLEANTFGNRFVIWMSCQEASTGRHLNPDWWKESKVEDELGNLFADQNPGREIRILHGSSSGGLQRPSQDNDHSFSLAADPDRLLVVHSEFPLVRSKGPIKIRVYNIADEEVAMFSIPNPVAAPTVEWVPEPLPVTRKNGTLELTLKQVTSEKYESENYRDGKKVLEPRLRLQSQFEFMESGQATREWNLSTNNVSDVLGNPSNPYDVRLSLFEPAWKLETQVFRNPDAHFPENCFTSIGSVQILTAGQIEQIGTSYVTAVGSAELLWNAGSGTSRIRMSDISGRGNSSYHGGVFVTLPGEKAGSKYVNIKSESRNGAIEVEVTEAPLPFVLLGLPGVTGDHVVYARGVDESGRKVPVQVTSNSSSASENWFLWMAPESDAARVDLQLIIDSRRNFEFFIKPPEVEKSK